MSKHRILFIIVFVFLLTRLLVYFTSIDKLYLGEDLGTGVMAKELMEGPDLPLFDYQYLPYAGGTFVVGLMAVPFFMLFGPYYFALELVPLLFSTAILIVLFLFARKFFNRRVAIIAAILYIFSSSEWGRFNFFLGFHVETLFFTFLAIYIFYEIIFNNKTGNIYYLSLGFISGLGTYLSYTFLVTLAAISLIWFIHDRRLFLKKGLYIFVIGLLIGLAPWFFYNLGCNFIGVRDIFDQFFAEKKYSNLLSCSRILLYCLKNLWFPGMLRMGGFGYFFSRLYGAIYYLIYCLSLLYILRNGRRSFSDTLYSKYFFMLIFPVLLIVAAVFYSSGIADIMDPAYLASRVEERYLVGLFPFVFLTVAIAIDKLFSKIRIFRTIAISAFSILIVLTGIGYSRTINFKDFGKGFDMLGYSYLYLSETFIGKYPYNLYKILDNMTRLSAPEKYETLTLCLNIDLRGDAHPVNFGEYLKLSERLDERYKPFFYKILIKGLYYNSSLSLKDLIGEVDILSRKVEDKYRPYLYQGVGAIVATRYTDDTARYKDGIPFIDKRYIAYYYKGLNDCIYTDDIPTYIQRCKNTLERLDDEYKPSYMDSMGEVLARFALTTFMGGLSYDNVGLITLYDFFNNSEIRYRKYLLEGAGRGLSYVYSDSNNSREFVNMFVDKLKEEDRRIITEAMVRNLKS